MKYVCFLFLLIISFPVLSQEGYDYIQSEKAVFLDCNKRSIHKKKAKLQADFKHPQNIVEHFIAAGKDKDLKLNLFHPDYEPYGGSALFNPPLPFYNEKRNGDNHDYSVLIDFMLTYSPDIRNDSIAFLKYKVVVEEKIEAINLLIFYYDSSYERWFIQGEHPYVQYPSFVSLKSIFRMVNSSYVSYLFGYKEEVSYVYDDEELLNRNRMLFLGTIDLERLYGYLNNLKRFNPEKFELVEIPFWGWNSSK